MVSLRNNSADLRLLRHPRVPDSENGFGKWFTRTMTPVMEFISPHCFCNCPHPSTILDGYPDSSTFIVIQDGRKSFKSSHNQVCSSVIGFYRLLILLRSQETTA